MKYLGTISNSQDIITKGWLIKNVASVIPDGSITASKLAEDIETSAMVATEVKNPVLTKSGDTFIWTISATEHGLMSTALSVIVYDTNGKQVACDISVGNDYGVTVSIYDNSTATSVNANTYTAVIIGNGSPKTSDINELVTTELDKKQLRTDLLTLEESENPNTDNMVIPFYDTLTGSNKKVALSSLLFGTSNLGANVVTRAKMAIDAFTLADNAGAHNAVYRGKNLGSAVTEAQWAAIQAGTFEDLFIGDYWTINEVNWRIAAFDYYYKTGNTSCTTHHVVIVPDTSLYTYCMNDTNITTGGYVGSKMYTEGLAQAKTTINNAFGSSHILSHRQLLVNAVTNGKPSGGSWYDSTVELMTEQNVYGGKIFGVGNDSSTIPNLYTIDKSQFPLFSHDPSMISNRHLSWLRNVVSATSFASVSANGNANYNAASFANGVCPAFSIKS